MDNSQHSLRSINELVSETLIFFQNNWQTLVPIVLVAAVPTFLHDLLVPQYIEKNSPPAVLLALLAAAASIWMGAALLYSLRRIVGGERTVTLQNAYKLSTPLIIPLLVTGLIYGLIIAGGLILLIIPGIIFAVWGFASQYVVVFENILYFDAFKRSKQLAQGYWFDIFGRWIVLIILTVIVNIILHFIPYVGSVIAQAILGPMSVYYIYLLYKDLHTAQSMAQSTTQSGTSETNSKTIAAKAK